jgi:hypothetical protein
MECRKKCEGVIEAVRLIPKPLLLKEKGLKSD